MFGMANTLTFQERDWDKIFRENELELKRLQREIRIGKIKDALFYPVELFFEAVTFLLPGMMLLFAKLVLIRMTIQIPKRLARVLREKLEEAIQRHERALEKASDFKLDEELCSMLRNEIAYALELKAMLRRGYLELAWPDALYVGWVKRKWSKTGKTPSVICDFHSLYYRTAVIVENEKGRKEITMI